MKARMAVVVLACLSILAACSSGKPHDPTPDPDPGHNETSCVVRGYVTWNGNPVGAGEDVYCQKNGDTAWAGPYQTNSNGFYSCTSPNTAGAQARVQVRGQDLGVCVTNNPLTCPSSAPQVLDCNVNGTGTCKNPSGSLAVMLLPSIFLPREWRRRRGRVSVRSDPS